MKYYSTGQLYSISGSGFSKAFEILSKDIAYQRLDEGVFLLLNNKGSVAARHLDKNMERQLMNLSGVYFGLVERHAVGGSVYYDLCDDIIQALYRIFSSVERLKGKKLEVFHMISQKL